MKRYFLIICVLILEFSSAELFAFDGQRRGFIFGGGLGGAFVPNQFSGKSTIGRTERKAAFLAELKIGYALTNSTEIYYVSKSSWWVEDERFNSNTILLLWFAAIGMSKYLSSSETGFFFKAGIGLSVLKALENSVDSLHGWGFFAGVGYELAKHWSTEIELLYSGLEESGINLDSYAVRVTLNFLQY